MARAAKRVQQPFDLEHGRFALSPRYAVILALVGASVATSVGAVHYRLGTQGDELQKLRVDAQTKTEAQLQCLRMQITNKGWRCPDAPQQQVTETKRFQPTMGAWRVQTRAPE
jgi:hypothetical protein